MPRNLLPTEWRDIDSTELRLLLDHFVGGPGQFQDLLALPNKLCLPLAGSSCQICITYRGKRIVSIEPGEAFDPEEWDRVKERIGTSVLSSPTKVGRDYNFSSRRVQGWWQGNRTGVQILPPPHGTPRAPVEMADHPFVLEYRFKSDDLWLISRHRRTRKHRQLTHLLNLLLVGHTKLQFPRAENLWVAVPAEDSGGQPEIKWVQPFFLGKLGEVVADGFESHDGEQMDEVDPHEYYSTPTGPGEPLSVPTDLDDMICRYLHLSREHRSRFDRAAYWMDMASRQWNLSVSLSFASLISAVESLTQRGEVHRVFCDKCGKASQHEVPGAVQRFHDFFEKYASEDSNKSRRSKMYNLRSNIHHGSDLMQLDREFAFGLDLPEQDERDLHGELWSLSAHALRNWLKSQEI